MRFRIILYAFFVLSILCCHPVHGDTGQGTGPFLFDPIHFETGQTVLRSDDLPELEKVLALLKSVPSLELIIEGNTDSQGANDANLAISLKRARWAAEWLVQKGINHKRLRSRGYGESRPIMDNHAAAGRAINRRIEFKVVAYPKAADTVAHETVPKEPVVTGKRASAFLPEKFFTFKKVVEGTEVLHHFPVQNQGDGILEIQKVKTG